MDILRALSSPNPDICQKVLSVAMDVVSAKNVNEVVAVLKREVTKTLSADDEAKSSTSYRNLLIKTIHGCAVRFPSVAESVVHTLMELVGTDSGLQVILFVRAIMEQYPTLRAPLLSKLMSSLDEMTSNQVLCVSLWIIGEYSETDSAIEEAFEAIVEQTGEPPFLVQAKDKEAAEKEAAAAAAGPKMVTKNVVLSDGTYATQTVYSEPQKPAINDSTPSLRKLLISGDVFLGETLAVALTKLCLRGTGVSSVKTMVAKSVVIMCGIVKMAEITVAAQRSSLADCQERLTLCVRALLDPAAREMVTKSFLEDGRERFAQFLKILKEKELKEAKKAADAASEKITTQADDLIHFRQLKSANDVVDLDDDSDLARATGYDSGSLLSSELSHVFAVGSRTLGLLAFASTFC